MCISATCILVLPNQTRPAGMALAARTDRWARWASISSAKWRASKGSKTLYLGGHKSMLSQACARTGRETKPLTTMVDRGRRSSSSKSFETQHAFAGSHKMSITWCNLLKTRASHSLTNGMSHSRSAAAASATCSSPTLTKQTVSNKVPQILIINCLYEWIGMNGVSCCLSINPTPHFNQCLQACLWSSTQKPPHQS